MVHGVWEPSGSIDPQDSSKFTKEWSAAVGLYVRNVVTGTHHSSIHM